MRLTLLAFVVTLAFSSGCAEAPEQKTESGDLIVAAGTFVDIEKVGGCSYVVFLDSHSQVDDVALDCNHPTTFVTIPRSGDQFRIIQTGTGERRLEVTLRAEDAEPPERL